jgi:coenzyme F420-reducing hydrogenase beta subunit
MYVFEEKKRCSGCTACMHVCPVNAISMKTDQEGFNYPEIDKDKCIECNQCRKICPFNSNYDTKNNFEEPEVYAVKNKNEKIRLNSSSGGIFTILAERILKKDGIVYGAAFDEKFKVEHMKIKKKPDLHIFRGSKYVQSDLNEIFLEVENDLKNNKYVLFSGTPCQIAGLNAHVDKELKNKLFLIDLVCAGVPSPEIWDEYISLLLQKQHLNIDYYTFRSKIDGWHNSKTLIKLKNKEMIVDDDFLDSFKSIFNKHVALRPSCHSCPYTNFNRPGDITIGDFWGIEDHMPEFDDDKGISLILVNTKKGKELFEDINDKIIFNESNLEVAEQRNLLKPTPPSSRRDEFWDDFNEKGYEYVAKKYTTYGFKNRGKKYLKILLKKIGLFNILRN